MLKLIKTLFFLQSLFVFCVTSADFSICDSWNLKLWWKNIVEICNWWYISNDITEIKSFTGSFSDFSWVIIENKDYINLDINRNLIVWFFDKNKKTVLTDKNIDYSVPIWFIFKKRKSRAGRGDIREKQITYKNYLKQLLKQDFQKNYFRSWISRKDYDIFIENIVDLLVGDNWDIFISNEIKNYLKQYFSQSVIFKENIIKLLKNASFINKSFKKFENSYDKIYVINYYLN